VWPLETQLQFTHWQFGLLQLCTDGFALQVQRSQVQLSPHLVMFFVNAFFAIGEYLID
jgi:hypothetical protein